MKNLGTIDRLLRVVLAEVCLLWAFFWAGREWQIPLYLVAGVMLLQAVRASCGVYSLLGWNTCEIVKRRDKNLLSAFVAIVLIIAVFGSYGSAVLTRNIYLDDLGRVKEPYDQTLLYSGQGMRQEAVDQFGLLDSAWRDFRTKYTQYRPLVVKFDKNFTKNMEDITTVISESGVALLANNLTDAHDRLQEIDLVLNRMLEG